MNGGIILRIEHISKNFGAIRAVDDVSLDILDGEMHAIIGSNGAGEIHTNGSSLQTDDPFLRQSCLLR